jgi:hypothetical protein
MWKKFSQNNFQKPNNHKHSSKKKATQALLAQPLSPLGTTLISWAYNGFWLFLKKKELWEKFTQNPVKKPSTPKHSP